MNYSKEDDVGHGLGVKYLDLTSYDLNFIRREKSKIEKMQNLLRNFVKSSRVSFMPQPMLHYLRAETIYDSKEKVLVRVPDRLLPFTANHLWDNDGARRTARRLGRGPGSSKGYFDGND